jgi:DNA mismatch endonuclease Vsr
LIRTALKRRVRGKRTKAQISFNMSRVRSTGSEIEKRMHLVLARANFRVKKHPKMFGSPDFVFPRMKIAIFCDSHFWHGYRWKTKQKEIRRNRAFWVSKILSNMRRDRVVTRRLRREGWIVLRFWEHQIMQSPEQCISRVKQGVDERKNAA